MSPLSLWSTHLYTWYFLFWWTFCIITTRQHRHSSFLLINELDISLPSFHFLSYLLQSGFLRQYKIVFCFFKIKFDNLKLFFKDFIYLFLERGWGREKGKETSVCGFLLCAPYWGPGLQPRHVPWLGIEWVILWFTDLHLIYWATPAKADNLKLLNWIVYTIYISCNYQYYWV